MSGQDLSDLSARLDQLIGAGAAEQTAWLARLASFDSTRGKEGPCQAWLAAEFERRGWSVDSFAISEVDIAGKPGASAVVDVDYDKAIQVVATAGTEGGKGRSLILQGHIDVVPTGAPELWERDPFTPVVKDGRMYGRGVNDMKVGVAAMVHALDALAILGFAPDAPVFVETVSEEECTGNGALATLERGYRADAALIPESVEHKLLRAELGSVWVRARILGKPGHVMAFDPAANANLAAYEYVQDLIALTAEINQEARDHPWFGHIEDPVKFSLGKIHGGDWLGSVPSWCEIECRMSVLPGHPLPEVRARVIERLNATAERLGTSHPEVTWIGFQADGHVFEPGTEAETTLAECHETVMGAPLETFSQTATSDTRQYDLYYGIPTLCYGGHGGGSHSPAEYTDLASMARTTRIIALFIARWCGLRPISG